MTNDRKWFQSFMICFIGMISFSISAQDTDCKQFRTGHFTELYPNGKQQGKIKRTKKYQFEQYGDLKIKLKIEWLDECTYKLSFVKGNKVWKKSGGNERKVVLVRIIEIDGESYSYEAKTESQLMWNSYPEKHLKLK